MYRVIRISQGQIAEEKRELKWEMAEAYATLEDFAVLASDKEGFHNVNQTGAFLFGLTPMFSDLCDEFTHGMDVAAQSGGDYNNRPEYSSHVFVSGFNEFFRVEFSGYGY